MTFAKVKLNEALKVLQADRSSTAILSSAIIHVIQIDDRDVPQHAMTQFIALKKILLRAHDVQVSHRKIKMLSLIDS